MYNERFTFLCSEDEKRLLALVSQRLHRSMSDTVRALIREKATELELTQNYKQNPSATNLMKSSTEERSNG